MNVSNMIVQHEILHEIYICYFLSIVKHNTNIYKYTYIDIYYMSEEASNVFIAQSYWSIHNRFIILKNVRLITNSMKKLKNANQTDPEK